MIEVLRRMRERNTTDETEPFDITTSNVEADIRAFARRSRPEDYAPPATRHPLVGLPDYVQHAEGADEIAKITAHAVITQYEECAKSIEAMGGPLKELAEGHQRSIDDIHAALQYVADAAQHCRDLGAGSFDRFQKTAGIIAEVRRICDESRGKIEPAV